MRFLNTSSSFDRHHSMLWLSISTRRLSVTCSWRWLRVTTVHILVTNNYMIYTCLWKWPKKMIGNAQIGNQLIPRDFHRVHPTLSAKYLSRVRPVQLNYTYDMFRRIFRSDFDWVRDTCFDSVYLHKIRIWAVPRQCRVQHVGSFGDLPDMTLATRKLWNVTMANEQARARVPCCSKTVPSITAPETPTKSVTLPTRSGARNRRLPGHQKRGCAVQSRCVHFVHMSTPINIASRCLVFRDNKPTSGV